MADLRSQRRSTPRQRVWFRWRLTATAELRRKAVERRRQAVSQQLRQRTNGKDNGAVATAAREKTRGNAYSPRQIAPGPLGQALLAGVGDNQAPAVNVSGPRVGVPGKRPGWFKCDAIGKGH